MSSPLHIALGLTDTEYALLLDRLGRTPNSLELAMVAVMWSEHCSYKSSRIHLRSFPTTGEHVLMGPGENAGVIEVGDGVAIAIRMESHNHPSAIEPYQGAATGVGGILRDIFTVGARPIALLDSLWMGPLDQPRSNWVFKGVVRGISGYGNAVGVPTVGGEITFANTYISNPLVNVAAVGVTRADRLVRASASGVGNTVILIGSSTGRDGIGGVSVLASSGFNDAEGESKRPSVQVGDPFEEKKLIEACLELLDRKMVVGIQDLGGAGLSCATSETAANAKMGMDFYLDRVPLRELDMEPFEIMTSESQERMLAIVEPSRVEEVLAICRHWEVVASIVGVVREPEVGSDGRPVGMLRILDTEGGEVLGVVPAALLADEAPLYDRPSAPPADLDSRRLIEPSFDVTGIDAELWLKEMLFDPSWIYSQYDHRLFLNTIVGPGADSALIRVASPEIGETEFAMAISADGNPRWCEVDPFWGSAATVVESALNVAVLGAQPKALVDCLNFGNPEHPVVMWQLKESIAGMTAACQALEVPVVGGNVSLYNEAGGTDIFPTPVVTTLGVRTLPDELPKCTRARPGDQILIIGSDTSGLAGSFAAVELNGDRHGELFKCDLIEAANLVQFAISLSTSWREFGISAITNVSSGGIALCLAEMALEAGVGIALDPSDALTVDTIFCEAPNRIICATSTPDSVLEAASGIGIEAKVIGSVFGDRLTVPNLVDISLEGLIDARRRP